MEDVYWEHKCLDNDWDTLRVFAGGRIFQAEEWRRARDYTEESAARSLRQRALEWFEARVSPAVLEAVEYELLSVNRLSVDDPYTVDMGMPKAARGLVREYLDRLWSRRKVKEEV